MCKKTYKYIVIAFFVLVLTGTCFGKVIQITGRTMGTTYSIKAHVPLFRDVISIKKSVEKKLDEINASMSVFDRHSEISRFNRSNVFEMEISDDFNSVLKLAKLLWKRTDGSLDITISPLIELWGFGRNKAKKVPSKDEIAKALRTTGFNHIKLSNSRIKKLKSGITLNLGSIAKGFGVDSISNLLKDLGIDDFFVEIGGEIYASGTKRKNVKWVIGINTPNKIASPTSYFRKVELMNKAIATSGDYRNYFQKGNKNYSHIINPKTGSTVSNHVVSASVIAKNCTLADGLATAVMVMGRVKGLALLKKLRDVEGLIVVNEEGVFQIYKTNGFILKE
ncbi:MAG: FAD:protein FMN transferase [Deltaproteobacteria bacterium]|nr:FAD:protein FMN transferase [Deltaproteobacteria bacterium]